MINLTTGQFYGQTNELLQLEGLTLTDTEYTHDYVDWHYHENAGNHVTVGKIMFSAKDFAQQQGDKDFLTSYKLLPGSLLFITAFFEKSLAEYLPALAPELTKEEAIKKVKKSSFCNAGRGSRKTFL